MAGGGRRLILPTPSPGAPAPIWTSGVAVHIRPGLSGDHCAARARGRAAPAEAEPEHPPLPVRPAIPVLVFGNLSADPGQDDLAVGIAQEIITALSHAD
jgi:hypothetical protein